MKNRILSFVLASVLTICPVFASFVYADDQAFEDYSREVGEEIAKQGDSAEDYYQNQEEAVGKEAGGTEAEDETEQDASRVDTEETNAKGKLTITSFHGYAWGTSESEIRKAEVSSSMENTIDYSLKGIDASGNVIHSGAKADVSSGKKLETLGVKGYSIGGYDATSFYLFEDRKLTGGVYEFFMDYDTFLDLTSQCAIAYGKASESGGQKDDDTRQPYMLWVDDDGNFIFASVSLGIMYGQKNSALLGVFSDGIQDTCGIDIEQEISDRVKS